MKSEKLKKVLNATAIPLIILMVLSLVICVWLPSLGWKLFASFFIVFWGVILIYRIWFYNEK